MALARTDLLGQVTAGTFGTGNFTSSSFTPSSSSLLVVAGGFIENAASTDPSSAFVISGGGLTWTQRVVQVVSPTSFPSLIKIWTAPVTTGSSMTITLGTGGLAAGLYACSVVCYTGYDTTTPIGATAVGSQSTGLSNPNHASITLSGAPATTSEVFAGICIDKDQANSSPGATYTEIHDVTNTTWGGLESEFRGSSASTTVDWANTYGAGGGNVFNWAAAAIEVRAAAAAGLVFPPSQQTRRRTIASRLPRPGVRASTPVRAQLNPPFPFTGVKQPRRLRAVGPRRGEAWMPVPPQALVVATPVPLPVRSRLKFLRAFRGRSTAPVPPQAAPAQPAYPLQTLRARVRGLRLFRPHLVGPPAADQLVPAVQRPRLRLPRLFRSHVVAPVPPQVVVAAPSWPPQSVRTRLRGVRLARGRAVVPPPGQVVVAAPAYPLQSVRTRLRAVRLFRGRAAAPVPPQIAVTPAVFVPQSVRARLRFLRLFRSRSATPIHSHAAPAPAASRTRSRIPAPRRGHAAMPAPPQITVAPPAYPPRPVRARLKGLRPFRGREAAMPVPPQVVIVPPKMVPAFARIRQHAARILRGQWRTPVPMAVCDCETHRPNSGVTGRPNGGITTRPGSGITARGAAGMTVRPDDGTTPRPCTCGGQE